jgi:AraC-like DNA-binding protein
MKVQLIQPKNERLKEFIECYYFFTLTSDEKVNYFTYPSLFTIVTCVSDAHFEVEGNAITTLASDDSPFVSSIVARFNNPIFLSYRGPINEITIYFKPLGLIQFLNSTLLPFSDNDFNLFYPYPDYQSSMLNVLKTSNLTTKIELMEAYWLEKLNPSRNKLVKGIVQDILDNDSSEKDFIHKIAEKHNLSRKTIHKLVLKNTGKTPTNLRKTFRFREALNNQFLTPTNQKLTQIAHKVNYFDQSHMIKDFKSMSGQNPKKFFNKTSKINDKIFWQML